MLKDKFRGQFPIYVDELTFSEREISVIIALNILGYASSTSKIARTAEIPRTTADYILRKFAKRKLVLGMKSRRRILWKKWHFNINLMKSR